jgi:plasmid stabilization system protein ParE
MNAKQGFELHSGAGRDINEIWEFIAADNPQAARQFREYILDAIRKLVSFPPQGHRRSDLTSAPLRFHTMRDYLIAYVRTKSRYS